MKQSDIIHSTPKKHLIAGSYLPAIISFLILVFIDQISKYFVDHNMKLYDSIPVLEDVFEIYYIQNPGAAWGMFENKQIFLYISTVIVLIISCVVYVRCVKTNQFKDIRILLVLILSGAVGNFIDRLRFQYVIDFLYFKLIDFPVFNIADCYVTVGFFFMLILLLFKYKEEDLEYLMKRKG